MRRAWVGAWVAGLWLCWTPIAGAEWQVSGEHKVACFSREGVDAGGSEQSWTQTTDPDAVQSVKSAVWLGTTNLTVSHVEADASRTLGLHIIAGKELNTPYAKPRLSHLILAWHGAAGSLEAGYVLTPLSWGRGLLLGPTQVSGGHAVVDWGTAGRSEAFWSDTVEDPRRFRYTELSLAGFRQTVRLPQGEFGLGVMDTSRAKAVVFPKMSGARGTYTQADICYAGGDFLTMRGEAVYARLLEADVKETRACMLEGDFKGGTGGTWWRVLLQGGYLGAAYNPPTGYYNVTGEEEGYAGVAAPLTWWDGCLRLRPGWGWKQRAAVDFWVPQGELEGYAPFLGTTLTFYARREIPLRPGGGADGWAYCGASLSWVSPWVWALTGRWEKIYNGLIHQQVEQGSIEIALRY